MGNAMLPEDSVGLNCDQSEGNPRQVILPAILFDTRKTVGQHQAGVVVDHQFSATDLINACIYGGKRDVFQSLSFRGNAVAADGSGRTTSAGGVIDLDRAYGDVGIN